MFDYCKITVPVYRWTQEWIHQEFATMLPNQDIVQHLFNFAIGQKLGKGLQTLTKMLTSLTWRRQKMWIIHPISQNKQGFTAIFLKAGRSPL